MASYRKLKFHYKYCLSDLFYTTVLYLNSLNFIDVNEVSSNDAFGKGCV